VIKYIGSKRVLVGRIADCIAGARSINTVLDLFSGTSRVGHELKRRGLRVIANDHNAYAHTLAQCYVQADLDEVQGEVLPIIDELNALAAAVGVGEMRGERGEERVTGVESVNALGDSDKAQAISARDTSDEGGVNNAGSASIQGGYVTRVFCREARYFHEKNGARIDAIRDELERRRATITPDAHAVLLTSLIEAADRVDSTTGLQMAYLKQLASRAHNDLCLRMPDVLPRAAAGKGQALMLDALDAARQTEADAVYIDPPYNQHSYLGNYHVWETIVRWDAPEAYGIARKRTDCRQRRSAFNTRAGCRAAMERLVGLVRVPMLVVSHSDEGFVTPEQVRGMLMAVAAGRELRTIAVDYPRYVGARIGIYNPRGQRVGEVSHLRNTEYISVLAPASMIAHIEETADQLAAAPTTSSPATCTSINPTTCSTASTAISPAASSPATSCPATTSAHAAASIAATIPASIAAPALTPPAPCGA
jgi:adenine-specific DNA-methyltransferase